MFAFVLDDTLQFSFLLLALLVVVVYTIPDMVLVLLPGLSLYAVGTPPPASSMRVAPGVQSMLFSSFPNLHSPAAAVTAAAAPCTLS